MTAMPAQQHVPYDWKERLRDVASDFAVQLAAQDAHEGCWIYGAGGFGQDVAGALTRGGYPVLGFIDQAARSAPAVGQFRCVHPDDLELASVTGKTYVHGLMNHRFASGDIARWAASLPFTRLLFPAELCQLPGIGLDSYWLANPSTLLTNMADIECVHDALADAASRELYRCLLRYRMSADPRVHPPVSVEDQYAPRFLPIFGKAVAVVDGGAYSGDTLETLLAHGVDVREWIAFEPDEQNFAQLAATAKAHRTKLQRYTIYPCGLSHAPGKIAFAQGRGPSSQMLGPNDAVWAQLNAEDAASIQALRLDDVIWTRADHLYIKLDIEGAELSALNGMMGLLAEKRPVVAVSIYHKPADIWEIPLFFMRNFEHPKLYVRQHGHHGFDTVLYVTW